jgi:glycosyltransferase 2 family protein
VTTSAEGPERVNATKPGASARRRLTGALVRLVGPVLLVLIVVKMRPEDRRGALDAIAGANGWWLLAALPLNFLVIHLKVIRWDVLLRTRGIVYPRRKSWLAFLTSAYVAMLTPGRVGDVLRIQYLRHDLDVPYSEGLASIVMDRLCDLYVLVVFVAFAAVRYSPILVGSLAWVTWIGVVGIVVGPCVFFVPGLAEWLMSRLYKRLAKGDDAGGFPRFLEALRANVGRSLLFTVPLTVAGFAINYVQGWLIARAIGVELSFVDATCLLAIASLLGLLPISFSGVGVREYFFSLAFPHLGFAAAQGVSFGLLVFFVIYVVIVAVGFVSWQIAPPPSGARNA